MPLVYDPFSLVSMSKYVLRNTFALISILYRKTNLEPVMRQYDNYTATISKKIQQIVLSNHKTLGFLHKAAVIAILGV